MTSSTQISPLFSNEILSRIERFRIHPRDRKTERQQGEHATMKGGTSTEFADFRDYVAGDDVRFIDWNIFARLNRPFLKLYRREEVMHVVILIDASTSMRSEGKFLRCQQLAAAFGIMALHCQEKVSIYNCRLSAGLPEHLPPCTGRASLRRLLSFVENLECGGEVSIDDSIELVLKNHRGRGICYLLSDFLTFGDLQRPFNKLYQAGMELGAIQVLGRSEIAPDLAGDLRLIDSEFGISLDISSAAELLSLYQEHRLALEERLSEWCAQRRGRFLSIDSKEPFENVLLDTLRRKGWVL